MAMKLRLRVDELVSILVKSEESLLKKYDLDAAKLKKLQKSLQEGNWRLIP